MADKIAIMSHGVIEQYGSPEEIYNRPATMFVADFVGSPPMNFIRFESGLQKGAQQEIDRPIDAIVAVPEVREDIALADMALGIRPEHIRFDDASKLRGAGSTAPNISAPRRSSRVDNGGRHHQGAGAGRNRGSMPATMSAWH